MRNSLIIQKTKLILVNGFIVFHLAAFASWSNPMKEKHPKGFVDWIRPYMLWSGLWQSWEMFAPDPLSVNAHLTALITFRDGTRTTWFFPRMAKLGYIERYQKERFRKWGSDNVRTDAYAHLWPDTARYIARLHYSPSNPPREIQLKRFWKEIPPPIDGSIHQPLPREYPHDQSFTFYVYQPGAEDYS